MGLAKRGNSNALERSPTILVSTVPAYELDGFGEWGFFFWPTGRRKEGNSGGGGKPIFSGIITSSKVGTVGIHRWRATLILTLARVCTVV